VRSCQFCSSFSLKVCLANSPFRENLRHQLTRITRITTGNPKFVSDLFNFSKKPDPYAVMGNPISHSKSPQIHQQFARQTQQDIVYQAIHVDVGGFPQAVGNFFANGGKGLNVTVPFKQEAFKLVDQLSDGAKLAGAVNTLSMDKEGKILGNNTDGIGLVQDLNNNHDANLTDKSILILGAGGATRGIILPLLHAHVADIVIVNRTLHKAEAIAKGFMEADPAYHISTANYDSLNKDTKFDVIINATSASLSNNLPPLAEQYIHADCFCYDMMYGNSDTVFMQWALRLGANHVKDGLGMLVEQAAESFTIWRGVKPDTKSVIDWIRQNL